MQPQIFQVAVLHIKIKWSHCKIIRLVFIGRMLSLIMEWLQGKGGDRRGWKKSLVRKDARKSFHYGDKH